MPPLSFKIPGIILGMSHRFRSFLLKVQRTLSLLGSLLMLAVIIGPNTILETSPKVTQLVVDAGLAERRLDPDPRAAARYVAFSLSLYTGQMSTARVAAIASTGETVITPPTRRTSQCSGIDSEKVFPTEPSDFVRGNLVL